MNVTTLLLAATATNQALQFGMTTDPSLIALTDRIFLITGADRCAFDACSANGTRILHNPTFIDEIVLGDAVPSTYNHSLYGPFFGWCRDFMRSYPPAPSFSATLRSHNPSVVTSLLIERASVYQACPKKTLECMCVACNVDSTPLKRARRAAESIEAILIRKLQLLEFDLQAASNQIATYWTTKHESASRGSGSQARGGSEQF